MTTKRTSVLLFGGRRYRYVPAVSASGLLQKAVDWMWGLIYRLGLTKEEVTSWLQSLAKLGRQKKAGSLIPDELTELVAKHLAKSGITYGSFVQEMMRALDNPPAGYRWDVDEWGDQRLIKVRSEIGEHGVARGKGFTDKVFIGVWWVTTNPKGSPHRKLVSFLNRNKGGLFLKNWSYPEVENGREYGGFILADDSLEAEQFAFDLIPLVDKVSGADKQRYRLSAVKLDNFAQGKRVEQSDKVKLPGINSIKFNWTYNLDDVLNGRAGEWKSEKEYVELLRKLRQIRDTGKWTP